MTLSLATRYGRGKGPPPGTVEDFSPPHIQRLRAAYCAKFLKTGELDSEMAAELRAYAASLRVGRIDRRRKEVV